MASFTVSYNTMSSGNLPLFVAQQENIFAQNGLDITLEYIASSSYMAALLSGQTPIATGGGSEVLSAVAGGETDLVIIAVLQPVYPYNLYASASIQSVDDMRGQKVGVATFGGTADIATRVALRSLGLNPETDVTLVQTGSQSNLSAALLSGAVDVGISSPPQSLQLEAAGFHSILDMAAAQLPTSAFAVVTTKSYAAAHRPIVQAYVDSLMEGIAFAKQDRPDTLPILGSLTGNADPTALGAAYDLEVVEVLPSIPTPSTNLFGDAVAQLSTSNPAVADVDLNSIVDESFVQNAVSRGVAGT